MEKTIFCLFAFIVFEVLFLGTSLRVSKDYQRVVVFRAGKFIGVRGPGIFFLTPFLERSIVIDLRPIEKKYDDIRLTTKDQDRVIIS